ncbi:MAG TPA: DUF2330 domain-containing protein [Gemmataceae bacterium]|nr:DUF2330 domain-containing protein [Gemmataceae bacterium]
MRSLKNCIMLSALIAMLGFASRADSMCGYFRPVIVDLKNPSEMLQPSQIAFITWDPDKKVETVTVQPRFEGNALDFGMVIPTPSQPKLDTMPRDFFKALGTFTMPKRRAFPESKLLPRIFPPGMGGGFGAPRAMAEKAGGLGNAAPEEPKTTVEVLEVGQVGSLEYKIIAAGKSDDLFKWLKDNKYGYDGDEATLNYYVQKKYFFTVMKIDTLQMKRNKDGTFTGDVTPTRFTFSSEKLVYPTRITQVSVKDETDALFYVQAPFKVDLPGDMTYQYQWVSTLQDIMNQMGPGELTETNRNWLKKLDGKTPALIQQAQKLGFHFNLGQQVRPNAKARHASTLEWAKKLTAEDIQILAGSRPFSDTVPDPDDGFTQADMRDRQRSVAITKIINHRLLKSQKEQPRGYLVRDAKKDDLKLLPVLQGHVQANMYLTKVRHVFAKAEMNEDLVLESAKVGGIDDVSDHEEVLRGFAWGGRGGRFGPRGGFDGFGPVPLPAPGGLK